MLPPRVGINSRQKKMSPGEKEFSKYLNKKGLKWIFLPCALDTGIPRPIRSGNKSYTPDFYCPETDTYYEVSSTRQAREQSIKKIRAVLKVNPDLKIIIVHPNGDCYGILNYNKTTHITTEDLSLKFKYCDGRIFQILTQKEVPWIRLRGGRHVYDKKKAINEINKHMASHRIYQVDGKKIRALRLKYKIPAAKLAPLLGVHMQEIYIFENGGRKTTHKKDLFDKVNNLESLIKTNLDSLKCTHKYRSWESYYN